MCGICGYFVFPGGVAPPQSTLRAMNDSLIRRGPDGEGFFTDTGVGLAMRRLSIIDVDHGWQPIFNEDRTVVVVLNGEIYNYRSLRTKLAEKGHDFRTNSDTEVLVHLYEEYGADFPQHLEGMFAFALWDTSRQLLVLGRDRLGIKPLFVSSFGNVLYFASEIKALRPAGVDLSLISPAATVQYFELGYIPAPLSIYANVRKVRPGVTEIFHDGRRDERQFWRVPESCFKATDRAETTRRVEDGLLKAVESHLVSDVPVGSFLSGGIDSGLITAMASTLVGSGMPTFTVGFDSPGQSIIDERPIAAEIARRYKTEHFEVNVAPDVTSILGEIVDAFDEPFADDSVIPTFYVSQIAASKVKVVLSGLGGDELFAGYRRHAGIKLAEDARDVIRLLRPLLALPIHSIPERWAHSDSIDHLKRFLIADGTLAEQYFSYVSALEIDSAPSVFSNAFNRVSTELMSARNSITTLFSEWEGSDAVSRAINTDLHTYLPDDVLALSDRLSMWHSLEVRVPFIDTQLVELSRQIRTSDKIRNGRQKAILRDIAERWLPASVLNHRKQGFEAPMGAWLRGPLLSFFDSLVTRDSVEALGIQNWAAIEKARHEHVSGKKKRSKFLFATLMFTAWSTKQSGLRFE